MATRRVKKVISEQSSEQNIEKIGMNDFGILDMTPLAIAAPKYDTNMPDVSTSEPEFDSFDRTCSGNLSSL